MHTLHGILTDKHDTIGAAKGVRSALRAAGERATLQSVMPLVEIAVAEGYVLILEHENPNVIHSVAEALCDGAPWSAYIDATQEQIDRVVGDVDRLVSPSVRPPTPEEAIARAQQEGPLDVAQDATPDGYQPDDVSAVTAVLLVHTEGNLIKAAVIARDLRRAAQDDLYLEVLYGLIDTFPWLKQTVDENGMLDG